ncbi:TPA: hypothetical protein ACRR13_000532 [Klebsiella quasipneumoniae]|uniref:hypothetical protein n=2 Tax=Klebsiella quasipneumoniae TaxID=1463165 RepID=UPI00115B038A|nr:hypothetical protein [Klebsiella quasipneumoniae]
MDTKRINAIENSMMCLTTFSRSIHTFFSLYKKLDYLDSGTGDLFPYRSICNALIGDAAINWCKVFGSDAEGTHWKCVVDDHKRFRKVLFSEHGITQVEFQVYWKKMTEFRNNIIAHFNVEHFSNGSTPEFDTAIAVASITHKYMFENLPSSVKFVGPRDLIIYGEEAAEAVMRRLLI